MQQAEVALAQAQATQASTELRAPFAGTVALWWGKTVTAEFGD